MLDEPHPATYIVCAGDIRIWRGIRNRLVDIDDGRTGDFFRRNGCPATGAQNRFFSIDAPKAAPKNTTKTSTAKPPAKTGSTAN